MDVNEYFNKLIELHLPFQSEEDARGSVRIGDLVRCSKDSGVYRIHAIGQYINNYLEVLTIPAPALFFGEIA